MPKINRIKVTVSLETDEGTHTEWKGQLIPFQISLDDRDVALRIVTELARLSLYDAWRDMQEGKKDEHQHQTDEG